MGWQRVRDLWTGRITDMDYTKREGYLQVQWAFQERDIATIQGEERILPFLIIFDKGFQVNTADWAEGQKLIIQPDFTKSNRRVSWLQILVSASVASNRGANEQRVNVSKQGGHKRRGFSCPNMFPIIFNKFRKLGTSEKILCTSQCCKTNLLTELFCQLNNTPEIESATQPLP
jgi:hypothetical protein